MAVLSGPLNLEMFQQLRGIVDFYYYKGLLCARAYPLHVIQPGTPQQQVTWDAMRTRGEAKRKLSDNVVGSFRNIAEASDKTWFDVFTTSWLTGYNEIKTEPPLVYDTYLDPTQFPPRVGVYCDQQAMIRMFYYYGPVGDKPKLFRWVLEQDTPSPPQCRARTKLVEYWPKFAVMHYTRPNVIQYFGAFPAMPGVGLWYTLITGRPWTPEELTRTGVMEYV